MKKSEIAVGKIYHNGKGYERKVIRIYHKPPHSHEIVEYRIIVGGAVGTWNVMFMPTFASWAKGEVT